MRATQLTSTKDHPRVIAWPPLIFAISAILSCLLHFAAPIRLMPYPVSLWIGLMLMTLSASVGVWAERTMQTAGTSIRPDRPALTIVKNGPYRFTRNPMYVSLCVLQLGVGFLVDGWIPLLFVVPLAATLHFGVIHREEIYLQSKFGEEYSAFKRQVRRWI